MSKSGLNVNAPPFIPQKRPIKQPSNPKFRGKLFIGEEYSKQQKIKQNSFSYWLTFILLSIIVVIGFITIIGVIVAFIYAIIDEKRKWRDMHVWSYTTIIKHAALNWIYVFAYWSTYGFL